MRVLFDQNTPRKLRRYLRPHLCMTAAQMGWNELENGNLIRVAEEAGFEVLLTGDQNIYHQQNNLDRRIALVVLTNIDWPSVMDSLSEIFAAVESASVGSFAEVKIRSTKRKPPKRSV